MHKMENTPKILSILGSALDFLGVVSMFIGVWVFKSILTIEFFEQNAAPEDMEVINEIVDLYQFIGNILVVLGFLLLIIFVVNLVVNIRLITGKLDERQAKVAYTYQLFIGIVLILLNTIPGICYIVSGVQGRNNEPDKVHTREGI